jgi:methyl-accepting chemotaxis protein
VKKKNDHLNETLQIVAAIAEETAAGVQEVNSSSQQQDTAIRKIAKQAIDINGLSQDLFSEIDQFEISDDEVLVEEETIATVELREGLIEAADSGVLLMEAETFD